MVQVIWIATILFISVKYAQGFKVIFERTTLKYINEKYIYNGTFYVKRHGRRSDYCLNIEGTNKMTFGNNVTLNLHFFEFTNSGYKRNNFVEVHLKICDAIKTEPYIGGAFLNAGLACPVKPGFHQILNISLPTDNFPNVWPYERCKAEASLTHSYNGDVIAAADVYASIKQKLVNG